MTEKIVVTGGCGFVGANLIRKLLESGNREIRVLDDLSKGNRDYLDGLDVEIFEGDVRDRTGIGEVFDGTSKVVHLAAYGSVVDSVADPETNFDINVRGTFNVLRQCVANDVEKLVFASTGGALIGDAIPPVNEKSLPKPISPYGAGKLCGEAYCHAFSRSYGMNAVCLRFANVYGPYSDHKQGVLNQFVKRLVAGEPLIVYGDGSATRDYIHVSDLCEGIALALDSESVGNDVIHLASGRETSLNELAELMKKVAGKPDHPVKHEKKRVGEVERNFASYEHAREVLGFAPKVELEDGLEALWEWLTRDS